MNVLPIRVNGRIVAATVLLMFALTSCNTTKTDSRNDTSDASGKTNAEDAGGAAPGKGVLAGPSVGAVTSVSPPDGTNAPDFGWTDGRGAHKLSDYRGKVVMINFWGTWCPPCRRELPALVKIREELAPDKFEIIGINIGEQPRGGATVEEHIATFAKENNIRYPLVVGDENLVNAYGGVNVVPTTIIIDGTGKVIERIEGSRDEAGFRTVIERAM